jgi:CubicO group peptidase (beta-lactamase class C family)
MSIPKIAERHMGRRTTMNPGGTAMRKIEDLHPRMARHVPLEPPPPDEWIRRFATPPLMHQPGERWMYNTGAEVLSVLIARAARKPLDVFLQERIFEPRGTNDTSFAVPEAKVDRLATASDLTMPCRVIAGDFGNRGARGPHPGPHAPL